MRSPLLTSVLFLLSLSLAAATADAARSRRGGSQPEKKVKLATSKRTPKKSARGTLPRGAGSQSATIHKQKLLGGDQVMAEIARSPGLPGSPVADSFIRGKLFFGDPEPSFRGSRAQRAILQTARRAGGTHDGTFELRDPRTRSVVGYYSSISTSASSGIHVFHDRMGRKVATTPFTY
ncbi:MAG TPA: hypothetical protein VFU21_31770 [Kofleriaceae bacterium]|nr:hypothetical protein [Kofleriaceae bacterium]